MLRSLRAFGSQGRRVLSLMLVPGSLGLLACSSSDTKSTKAPVKTDAGTSDAGATCNEALAARRTSCEFTAGSFAADTVGKCAAAPNPIEHIVVLMQENRSFDHYFGHLPGHGQDDVDVAPTDATNPSALDAGVAPGPIAWHHDSEYCISDTDHGWVASHGQYNGGLNDGFATTNVIPTDRTGQRALGYYDQTDIPFYYDLISTFATSDRYFCALLGPTYPNRLYLLAGTSFGVVSTASGPMTITLSDGGSRPASANEKVGLAPVGVPQIFKLLNAANVTWKDYKSDLAAAFLFSDFVAEPAQASHFVDISQFAVDAAAGTLPSVSFIDPKFFPVPASASAPAQPEDDEHPPANIQQGQHFVWTQVNALLNSPQWKSSALFITYDEHGGMYDHVPPPAACAPDDTPPDENPELGGYDRLGFRVPLIVVSPYAKRHFVSHEVHTHTSILRFIEAKFGLPALTKRDANSDAMLDLFDFSSPPQVAVKTFAEPAVDATKLASCAATQ